MTPQERSARARIAAYRMHAAGKTNTRAALAAFDRKFEDEVDPNRELSEKERARRVAFARRAHFLTLSAKGVKARQGTKTA